MIPGIKMEVGFHRHPNFRKLYGNTDILTFLKEHGVQAAEFPVGVETDFNALRDSAHLCVESGIRVSIHPYSERTPKNPLHFIRENENECREFHETVFRTASGIAGMQGSETIVNIHSAAGLSKTPREHMVMKSVEFFEWAREFCREKAGGCRPVAELQIRPNNDEEIYRIGDFYDELELVAAESGVSACWDMGHAVMNFLRYETPLEPPESLLGRFAHVHFHDIDRRSDHRPLLFGLVPWKSFLCRLRRAGYNGTVIMEIPPENFLPYGGIEVLEASLKKVSDFLGSLA